MKKLLSWLVLSSLLVVSPGFAAVAQDLGEGLSYFRLRALPADLPSTPALKACVLDLRYTPGDAPAAAALAAWLKFHTATRTPVFLLANSATATALLHVLAGPALPAGTLTLGLPAPGFSPDIAIPTTAEAESRAYAALTAGTPLAALVQENAVKPRYDEAEMLRRKASGEPLESEEDDAPVTTQPTPPAPPLLDATLQRAVQLHRGLAALGLFKD